MKLWRRVFTAWRLGLSNVLLVFNYRLAVKLGIHPVLRLHAAVPISPFFSEAPVPSAPQNLRPRPFTHAMRLFSYHESRRDTVSLFPPRWHANAMTGQLVPSPNRPWWHIHDFDSRVGDIKLIWEPSRMDWLLTLAQYARIRDRGAMEQINAWLADWCEHNPPYLGANWKCGQEASIRVMHIAMTALVLGQTQSALSGLRGLIRVHLRRIAPTIRYAVAQDNNHGTSEAAALFIGGLWLAHFGDKEEGESWARTGRFWLEDRVLRLIGSKGTFSQYSLNYHRVMLDTLCMVEIWRRHWGAAEFSEQWRLRALAATNWLYHITDAQCGDGPNVGANDGARLLQLTNTSYRDYRPTVQLAMVLFGKMRAYRDSGPWDEGLRWLDVPLPHAVALLPNTYMADDGGFAILRRSGAMAMLRYPEFRFRPGQADALHLDLWVGSNNLLRDAGTYSYNTDEKWLNYFGGTASHNTVQFDDRDQMPRLSRFLFSDWLATNELQAVKEDGSSLSFGAGYRDSRGARHYRSVSLGEGWLRVTDDVSGFCQKAVLRWRLKPSEWQLRANDDQIFLLNSSEPGQTIKVHADVTIVRCELVEGWESRHYLEKTPLPVLEIEIHQPGRLTTQICWTQ